MLKIKELVQKEINELNPHLQKWALAHVIEPEIITLFTDADYQNKAEYWLVTGNTGNEDSNYRIIYSPTDLQFGLEMETEDGKNVLLGIYGDFATTLNSM